MANPHFQNLILWAGNTVASKSKKNLPMFQPYPSDQTYYGYFNDFMTYNSGDWTITTTEAGAGSATEAVTSSAGGALLLTNAAGDDDLDFLQLKGEAFTLAAGKRAFFSSRFKVSDVTQSDYVMGLHITDTSPLDVTDGIYFRSVDESAVLNFVLEKDSTETATAVATLADATYVTAEFFYTGSNMEVYINGALVTTIANTDTNFPDDELLRLTLSMLSGEATANTLTIKWVRLIQIR